MNRTFLKLLIELIGLLLVFAIYIGSATLCVAYFIIGVIVHDTWFLVMSIICGAVFTRMYNRKEKSRERKTSSEEVEE